MSFEQPSPVTFEPGERSLMAAANANPDNWEWCVESRKIWELASKDCQEFNRRWYGSQCATESASLSLELLSALGKFPSSILVRECYVVVFNRIWARAITSEGDIGALITGQPGTGKTLLLIYLLSQLLQQQQVVLFTLNGDGLYLFYHGMVYTTAMATLKTTQASFRLPKPKSQSSKIFMWSLFDIQEQQEPAAFLINPPCLPVQTASPDPIRFKTWHKEFKPLCIGLPLWTRDELAKGLPYQRQYNSFFYALHKASQCDSETDPLQPFPGARVLLNEFQEDAHDKVADMEAAGMDNVDTDSFSPEDALDYILGAAIERFGYSAQDVFNAVFDYLNTTTTHQAAFSLHYADLDDAIHALLSMRNPSNVCHQILTISPVYSGPYINDDWTVNFKSDWVARGVIQHFGIAECRLIYQLLQRFPQASAVAGYFLKPDIHCLLSQSAGQT